MPRSHYDVQFVQSLDATDALVRQILMQERYKEIPYNQEVVWKMGTGLMTAMHYIKLDYEGNVLHISGWVQIGVGSAGGKERDLTGFVATIPKQSVISTINRIRHNIVQAGGRIPAPPANTFSQGAAPAAQPPAPAPAAPQYMPPQPSPQGQTAYVFCPNCGAKLQIPAGQHLTLVCSQCKHSFEYRP